MPAGLKDLLRDAYGLVAHLLPRQTEDDRAAAAARYWTNEQSSHFQGNSHWREAQPEHDWLDMGREHRAMVDSWLRFVEAGPGTSTDGHQRALGRVVDWGAGGGGNAVAFAPDATEYVGTDISAASLQECERQLRQVCDTPSRYSVLDPRRPQSLFADVEPGSCDLFLSFYVFELLPSQAYALEVLDVAHRLLRPGGHAVIQTKYQTSRIGTRSRRRNYDRNLSQMTTFEVHDFWERARAAGFRPDLVHLVHESTFGGIRYAYYLLTKPGQDGPPDPLS